MKYKRFTEAMNKKLHTIVLFAGVLIIWGLIAFRVWKWLRPEQAVLHSEQVDIQDDHPLPDTLILDYRDPFLPEEKHSAKVEMILDAVVKTSEPLPSVRYKGMLRGKDGVRRAIIEYQGQIFTLAKGVSLVGITIREISPESIFVMWNGKMQTIEVQ